MPLFRQTPIQKNTPKTITLPNLYKHLFKTDNLSTSAKIDIMKALQQSGYDYSSASKIMAGKDLPISTAKEVATNLSKAGLKGFAQNDGHRLVDQYVKKEAIKRKNLSGRRRELMMESLQDDIYKDKSINRKSAISSTSLGTKTFDSRKPTLRF